MEKKEDNSKPHSAEYFGDYRDFWWNADYLELMGKRLGLGQCREVLDVGCGIGHWGRVLAPVLDPQARLIGVDREEQWVDRANETARARGLGDRFRYRLGDATRLPFDDASFDLVTCQTVLIHLRDPREGISEMLRVLKPEGLILVAEPNNAVGQVLSSSITDPARLEEQVAHFRFWMRIERGKQALGLGFNSAGDLIPGYFAELGVRGIRVYISDKATPLFAPYETPEMRANVALSRDWVERGFPGWDTEELRGYFVAGGGKPEEFEAALQYILRTNLEQVDAIDRGTYHCAGGSLMYLVSGRKA